MGPPLLICAPPPMSSSHQHDIAPVDCTCLTAPLCRSINPQALIPIFSLVTQAQPPFTNLSPSCSHSLLRNPFHRPPFSLLNRQTHLALSTHRPTHPHLHPRPLILSTLRSSFPLHRLIVGLCGELPQMPLPTTSSQRQQPSLAIFIALSIFLAAASPSFHRLSPATLHLSGPRQLAHAIPITFFSPLRAQQLHLIVAPLQHCLSPATLHLSLGHRPRTEIPLHSKTSKSPTHHRKPSSFENPQIKSLTAPLCRSINPQALIPIFSLVTQAQPPFTNLSPSCSHSLLRNPFHRPPFSLLNRQTHLALSTHRPTHPHLHPRPLILSTLPSSFPLHRLIAGLCTELPQTPLPTTSLQRQQPSLAIFIALSIFLVAAAPSFHCLSPATLHLSGPRQLAHAIPITFFSPLRT
ncbi:hypothetical protein MRB53_012234 [Persea americana]|uniref:Uncharacterized protein n=1 Tax=Persea americana TaxID=3435 RepID=A0ACC2LYE9_PERAE|nr:hypothetical protein MRB53_012234 [Persea americana]